MAFSSCICHFLRSVLVNSGQIISLSHHLTHHWILLKQRSHTHLQPVTIMPPNEDECVRVCSISVYVSSPTRTFRSSHIWIQQSHGNNISGTCICMNASHRCMGGHSTAHFLDKSDTILCERWWYFYNHISWDVSIKIYVEIFPVFRSKFMTGAFSCEIWNRHQNITYPNK